MLQMTVSATIIDTNTVLEDGQYTYEELIIRNNSVLTLNSNPSALGSKGVELVADNIVVEAGSSISADRRGYPAEQVPERYQGGQ